MKTINLRIPDDEHAAIAEAANAELIPMTALLRRLFRDYNRARIGEAQQQQAVKAAPKQGPKAEAEAAYQELVESLYPRDAWSVEYANHIAQQCKALRDKAGVGKDAYPVPEDLRAWAAAERDRLAALEREECDRRAAAYYKDHSMRRITDLPPLPPPRPRKPVPLDENGEPDADSPEFWE